MKLVEFETDRGVRVFLNPEHVVSMVWLADTDKAEDKYEITLSTGARYKLKDDYSYDQVIGALGASGEFVDPTRLER